MNNNLIRSIMAYQMQHPPRVAQSSQHTSRLPAGYTEVAYIEANKDCYIDTGLKAAQNDEYIVTYAPTSTTNLPIFGDSKSKTDSNITLWIQSNNHANFNFGNGNSTTYVLEVDMPTNGLSGFHTYRQKNSTAEGWIDGVYKGHVTLQNFSNSIKMIIFASWRDNKVQSYGRGMMKDFIWYRGDEKIRHYVPCVRNSDGKAGMYDLCESISSKTGTSFYTSQTNNNFVSGGHVPSEDEADIFFEIEVNNPNESKTIDATFLANASGLIVWGDGTTTDETQKTHVYAQPGRYVVKLISSTLSQTATNTYLTLTNVNLKRVHKFGGTRISTDMFNGISGLTVADDALTENLVTIGLRAFLGCSSVELHSLPNSIQTIGAYAFKGTRIMLNRLPNSLQTVQEQSFYECTGLNISSFPNNLSSIGKNSFAYCSGITATNFPSLTSLGANAFDYCTGITGVVNCPVLTQVGAYAFRGCTGITGVNMPNVTVTNEGAFNGCTGMTGTISLPSATTIGSYSFDSTGITDINLPNVTYIERAAFRQCTGLTDISLPSATTIQGNGNGAGAFRYCTGLTSVNAPNVTYVGIYAFAGCTSLQSVILSSNNVTIDTQAFSGCTSLSSISIDNVASINVQAFYNCSSLTSLMVRETSKLGMKFIQGSGVRTLEVRSSNLTTIDRQAFEGSGVTNCYIEAPNLETVEILAFSSNMVNLYFNVPVFTCAENSFSGMYKLQHVYVPFSQSEFDFTGYVSNSVTVHYNYVFPQTNFGHFFD